jgi:MarR family transcriptional regulator, organic hydroperoxide resistance regulator
MSGIDPGNDKTADADRAWQLLWELFESLHGEWAAHIEQLGLTEMQAHMLDEIEENPPSSMRAHAQRMRVDPSWITDLVDQLERRGDVVRRPSPDDRRVKLVELTDKGRLLREQVHIRVRQAPPALRELPPAEQRQLLAIMRAAVAGHREAQAGRAP